MLLVFVEGNQAGNIHNHFFEINRFIGEDKCLLSQQLSQRTTGNLITGQTQSNNEYCDALGILMQIGLQENDSSAGSARLRSIFKTISHLRYSKNVIFMSNISISKESASDLKH